MKHALLSPSSAHRWIACPGSVEANRNKPRSDNIHSNTGTAAHALLEIAQRLDGSAHDYVGQKHHGTGIEYTEEMAEAVDYALEYVNDYMRNDPGAKLFIEQPVYPGKLLGIKRDLLWGTPDIQIHGTKELVTVDYKHGVGVVVEVKDNHQLKIYHLGGATTQRYRRYRSVIVQPRAPRRHPVQEHVLTDAQLMEYAAEELKPAIQLALVDGAPRKAGEHCRFCHANGNCEAQATQKLKRAAKEFSNEPKDIPLAKLGEYLQLAVEVEVAIQGLRERAVGLLHGGKKIPGWAPDWTRPRRVWADEEGAIKAAKKMGLTPKDIYTVNLLSPKQLEDLMRERGLMPKVKRGEPKPPNLFQDYYGYGDKKPTLTKLP